MCTCCRESLKSECWICLSVIVSAVFLCSGRAMSGFVRKGDLEGMSCAGALR